jgi:serine/threonine-protein kinase
MRRFPVTQADYLAYLNVLVAEGDLEKAGRRQPGVLARGELSVHSYERDADGRFQLTVDGDGDEWLPDWPVMRVDWFGARGYGRWLAARTSQAWRLPGELEWEKASRGTDGRIFPWGNHLDASWCHMVSSHQSEHPLPAVVDSYPVDCSPYGVRGLGGNTYDWCADEYKEDGTHVDGDVVPHPLEASGQQARVRRGGAWSGNRCRTAFRIGSQPNWRSATVSFRLVRSFD